MAPLVLYHSPFSPFSRSVILLTRYLKLDVEVRVLDLMAKEQMEPEFLKINPQHCVPTIDDNGFYLWESRAIQSYLLEAKAPELLLTSPKEKAILNQRLQFELGGLTNKFVELIHPVFIGASSELNEDKIKQLYDIFFVIDEHYFPNGNEWIAGENVTVADFAYVATISTLVEIGASLEKYPRLKAWFALCKTTFPDYEELNGKGAQMLGQFVSSKITKGF